jgi:hypothetical protein
MVLIKVSKIFQRWEKEKRRRAIIETKWKQIWLAYFGPLVISKTPKKM